MKLRGAKDQLTIREHKKNLKTQSEFVQLSPTKA